MAAAATKSSESHSFEGFMGSCRDVNSFIKLERIGEGTYGTVYKARDRMTDEIVALKKVKMDRENDGFPLTALRELKILRRLQHQQNIVHLRNIAVGKKLDSMFYVFEYCEHDLALLIDNRKMPFSESEVKCILLQLLEAVAYLHDNWIIHRDLKLSNLLFNNNGLLKLCDFGLAREYGHPLGKYTAKVVTLWYRPPELLLGARQYGTAVDMWGVGCIFGELLQNHPLLAGKSEIHQLELMCQQLGSPNDRIWPGYSELPNTKKLQLPTNPYNELKKKFPKLISSGHDLLNRFLTYDPEKRITAREALHHEYFKREPRPKDIAQMPSFPVNNNMAGSSLDESFGTAAPAGKERLPNDKKRTRTWM